MAGNLNIQNQQNHRPGHPLRCWQRLCCPFCATRGRWPAWCGALAWPQGRRCRQSCAGPTPSPRRHRRPKGWTVRLSDSSRWRWRRPCGRCPGSAYRPGLARPARPRFWWSGRRSRTPLRSFHSATIYDKKILLCSFTFKLRTYLLITFRPIRNLWQSDRTNRPTKQTTDTHESSIKKKGYTSNNIGTIHIIYLRYICVAKWKLRPRENVFNFYLMSSTDFVCEL